MSILTRCTNILFFCLTAWHFQPYTSGLRRLRLGTLICCASAAYYTPFPAQAYYTAFAPPLYQSCSNFQLCATLETVYTDNFFDNFFLKSNISHDYVFGVPTRRPREPHRRNCKPLRMATLVPGSNGGARAGTSSSFYKLRNACICLLFVACVTVINKKDAYPCINRRSLQTSRLPLLHDAC